MGLQAREKNSNGLPFRDRKGQWGGERERMEVSQSNQRWSDAEIGQKSRTWCSSLHHCHPIPMGIMFTNFFKWYPPAPLKFNTLHSSLVEYPIAFAWKHVNNPRQWSVSEWMARWGVHWLVKWSQHGVRLILSNNTLIPSTVFPCLLACMVSLLMVKCPLQEGGYFFYGPPPVNEWATKKGPLIVSGERTLYFGWGEDKLLPPVQRECQLGVPEWARRLPTERPMGVEGQVTLQCCVCCAVLPFTLTAWPSSLATIAAATIIYSNIPNY